MRYTETAAQQAAGADAAARQRDRADFEGWFLLNRVPGQLVRSTTQWQSAGPPPWVCILPHAANRRIAEGTLPMPIDVEPIYPNFRRSAEL